jgi:ankyrin repeat protein
VNVNLDPQGGNPPLVPAVWRRSVGIIDSLLARGADPNLHVYINGDTILHFAYRSRPYEKRTDEQFKTDREIGKKLLKSGSNPNAPDSEGWTFIMRCPDDLELLRVAFDCGAEINRKSKDGTPILYWFYNYPESLDLAISRGADVEARDRDQFTHLMRACYFGNVKAVPVLLRHGANVSATAPAPYGRKGSVDALALAKQNRAKNAQHEEIFQLIDESRPSFFARLFGKSRNT